MTHVEEMHGGRLELIDVKKGNTDIYARHFMDMETKKMIKKKTLATALRVLAEAESEPYVDITVTMRRKDDQKADVLPYVPPVRVWF